MSDPRPPLSRERVAAAALAFIDHHGEAALSMRKLGAELGVEAMSLYNHVANKEDLLDALSELLFREVLDRLSVDDSRPWQDDVREVATIYRDIAHQHRNAMRLLADRITPSPAKYEFLLRCYSIFTEAGFSTKDAALAFDTCASWFVGAIRQEMGVMAELEAGERPAPPEDLPVDVQAVHDFTSACLAWTPTQRFDHGLETMLAGLEWRLANV